MEKALTMDLPISDDQAWAERSSYWLNSRVEKIERRRSRQPVREPLVLTGHGMRLRVENGALLVQNGFTHYPQAVDERRRYFPGDRRLPSRIIVVDGSGSLSFDVLDWFAAQNVPLIRLDWRGEVQMVVGGIGYSADPAKVAAQVEAKRKGKTLAIATSLIRQKLENSIATMREALPEAPVRDAAIQKLQDHLSLLTRRGAKSIADLLGIEGGIARTYFAAWHSYPLKWKGTGRYPIPDHWRYIGPRQSINTGIKGKNRRASHPVNAILNYAYAVLESEVRIKVIAEGYDPSIGYLHMQNEKRPDPLVFDLMEPLRPVIDRRLLEFAQSHTFHPADFTIRSDGVCRLNPELASQIARVACTSNIRLEHIIKLGN